MSVDKNEMLLGTGEFYIDDVRVGNMKNALLTYTKEFVEAEPGDGVTLVRRDLIHERAVMTGTICDFDIARLPMLLGLTMSTSQLTNTTTLRIVEEITMPASTTTTKTLAESVVSTTNLKVFTPDYKTEYVRGSDYTQTASGYIAVKSSTMRSDPVLVVYDYADVSALRVQVGGKTTHEELKLKFVHKRADGKEIQITIPKAQMTGEFTMPFGEDAYTEIPISFTAVGDPALAKGQRLFTIVRER